MPIMRNGSKNVLYVHVPKTGGSSVEELFSASGYEIHLRDPSLPGSLNPLRRCSPQHMHASSLGDRLNFGKFHLTFMTVREPLARFKSEVVMRHPDLQESWNDDVEEWAWTRLRQYQQNPFVQDNHFRPQTEFYIPGSWVFRLEDGLRAMVDALNRAHNLALRTSIPQKPARKGTYPSYRVEIPRDLRQVLVDFYADDYIKFGYDYPKFSGALEEK